MRRGVIKDAGALKRPDANLPGCNAHGEGEDDRSLTPSNIKPDRSTSISCQIELHLIHFSCCRLPPAPPRQRHEPGRLLPRQRQTSFARRFCQANKCCGANRASGRPPTPTRRARKIAQRSAPSPPPPPPPAPMPVRTSIRPRGDDVSTIMLRTDPPNRLAYLRPNRLAARGTEGRLR
jgi:hypothetical protein